MAISNNQQFVDALAALSVDDQRKLGVQFIQQVVDLTSDSRISRVLEILQPGNCSAEELKLAHDLAHAVYTETNPRSDLLELDFQRQAAHFVSEACVVCAAAVYQEAGLVHIAQKVAMYCRMARTCASIQHDADTPDFTTAQEVAGKMVAEQMRMVEEFSG